nr:hypothetical protein [Tanacetum cinerariifolium]
MRGDGLTVVVGGGGGDGWWWWRVVSGDGDGGGWRVVVMTVLGCVEAVCEMMGMMEQCYSTNDASSEIRAMVKDQKMMENESE